MPTAQASPSGMSLLPSPATSHRWQSLACTLHTLLLQELNPHISFLPDVAALLDACDWRCNGLVSSQEFTELLHRWARLHLHCWTWAPRAATYHGP